MKAESPVQGTRPKRDESGMDRTSCELLLLGYLSVSYSLLAEYGSPPGSALDFGGGTRLDTHPARDCGTPHALGVCACCCNGGNCGKRPHRAFAPLTLLFVPMPTLVRRCARGDSNTRPSGS